MDNITVIVQDYPQEITVQVTTTGITVNQANQIVANTLKVSDINHVTLELPNVDNTSDLNKPVSTATNQVLNAETTSRTDADILLQTNINSEAATRSTNDDTLQSNINNLDTRVSLNDVKIGITTAQASEIITNNAKVGITTTQANEIIANNSKIGITNAQSNEIIANNAKVGITTQQTNDILANNARVGITTQQTNDIIANNAKISFDNTSSARLANTSGTNTGNQNANAVPLDDTNLIVAKETDVQDFAEEVDSALLRARGTGVAETYTSTVAVGGTTFSQGSFKGEVNSDQGYFTINYAGGTNITVANLTSISTYVYIDNAGVLQQQTTIPTREDFTRKIFTMRIGIDLVTNQIIGFEYLNNPIGHYANSIRDIYSYLLAQGIPFKKDQVVTGRSTDLGFDVSAGNLLEFGGTGDIYNPNIKSFNLVQNTTYNLLSRTGIVSSETNLVKFWDNNGVITALGSTTLVGHRLYRFSNGNFAIQYGQGNYANMALAKTGARLEEYELNPALKDATFFGWWFIESTATNTGGTVLTDFVEYTIGVSGGSSNSLSGCLLKGNNLSDLLDAGAARTNIGFSNVDNTSDANKPISTATQSALNLKVDKTQDVINTENTFKSVSFAMDYSDRVRDDSGIIESRDCVMNEYLKIIN